MPNAIYQGIVAKISMNATLEVLIFYEFADKQMTNILYIE